MKKLIVAIVATMSLAGCSAQVASSDDQTVPVTVSSVVVTTTPPTVEPSTTTSEVTTTVRTPPTIDELAALAVSLAVPGQVGTSERGYCTQYEPIIELLSPEGGWDVRSMSHLMWKESRCDPTARSRTRDSGLLQINDMWIDEFTAQWGHTPDFNDPITNIKAAAVLCSESRRANRACERPWGGAGL